MAHDLQIGICSTFTVHLTYSASSLLILVQSLLVSSLVWGPISDWPVIILHIRGLQPKLHGRMLQQTMETNQIIIGGLILSLSFLSKTQKSNF